MKVNIIGAGASGLCAGSYLRMQGFETEIFEKNGYSGGLCTSWKRGKFTFDGCIHWLMGTNPSNPFYQLWSELIDMSSVTFVNHETRVNIELKNFNPSTGENIFHLYTSLSRLEKYLAEAGPDDKKKISGWISAMRKIQEFEIPPMITRVPDLLPLTEKIQFIKHLPLLLFMIRWRKITNLSFAAGLKSPFLREAFEMLFDGEEVPLLILMIPLACNDKGSAGYPVGGSTRFIKNLEKKYLELGGKIRFSCDVSRILTEDRKAVGIELADGTKIPSDLTISAADWNFTFTKCLEDKFMPRKMLSLKEEKEFKVFYAAFLVSLGVKGNFSQYPHFFRFRLNTPVESPDGTVHETMEVHIMNYDAEMAEEGNTVISVKYYTSRGQYWIDLRLKDQEEYLRQKKLFASAIIGILQEKIPEVKGNIEETDIATPATYHRYTGNWKGSTQAWLQGKNLLSRPSIGAKVKGLDNFYYTSHWVQPGGGLPVAIKSARDMTMIICHDLDREFRIV